ncbi:hypothetical protein [Bradyrhizobium frederickii]|uniref:hypothetical protein n=1 Tax=Bradyrhizobium frederickii TaxID=2560054 RepID=UPI001F1658BA|nr:hypothetical protein [Bradyrhizobium frederickii]
MRCPDAVTDGGAGNRDPDQARSCARRDRTTENTDRDDAGDEADQASEHDEPKIMLDGKARQDAKHPGRSIRNIVDLETGQSR